MFLSEKIENYVVSHSQNEPQILQNLTKETWQKVLNPRMISGAYQGRVLSMISKLIKPKNVLEIGTFTGYSALSIAEGLADEGVIYTIDKNEELEELQQKYFNKSAFNKQIKTYSGKALDIIPTIDKKFDLVFIDADKSNYVNYFHLIINKMNSGGIILSDNVLWYGKVAEKADDKDIDTLALQEYNILLNNDLRIETVMLPIRDGLTISRVK
ncbi:MAG: Putative O-methyltransferase/MSMEI_4947 [Polaribacter sp. SA4-10]|nr:MAG: Putative O-methyltransferase/MSMEI_4947 [Polaribacter sp. SA4-10]|tara:strand:+ start:530 stop:1168 length:639 start_codon:yes stop_codon:yes gene_type:complete